MGPTLRHFGTAAAPSGGPAPLVRTYTAPVSDEPTPPVSVRKSGSEPANTPPAKPPPPRQVVLAAVALVLAGVAGLGAALSLYGLKGWLFSTAQKVNRKATGKNHRTVAELHHQVSTTITGQLVATLVVAAALAFMAFAVYRGRHWSRWGVLGLWVLSTFTATLVGFSYLVTIASSEPLAFKVPTFLGALLFVTAVVLTNLKPSAAYFNLSRPVRVPGAPGRRGLFAPRDPAQAGRAGASGGRAGARAGDARSRPPARASAAGADGLERSRAKQRAHAEAVAKGAELARTRAKASKSRRTGA